MNIYFSSDWHYHHKNRVRGCSGWEDKEACRDFDSLEEHDAILVQNINKTLKWDDIVYFLGDWSLGGIEYVKKFRDQLDVRKIHFIGGNHDHHIRRNRIVKTSSGFVNLRDLFSSYDELIDYKIAGHNIMMCHYPMRSWHKAGKGSWMLYGHEHGDLKNEFYDSCKTMDVGIDTHPDFRPYHLEEIREIMNNREDLQQGHHE